MENLNGCQIPCLPNIAEGKADLPPQPIIKRIKRTLAKPWNEVVKKYLKRTLSLFMGWTATMNRKEDMSISENGGTNGYSFETRVTG